MAIKTSMIGLPYGEKSYDDMLSRFHPVPERNGRTDRQTDLLYQYRDNNAITDLLKSPITQWWGRNGGEMEKWSGIRIWVRSPTKSQSVLPIGRPNHNVKFQWNRLVIFSVILLSEWHTDGQRTTTNLRLVGGGNNQLHECRVARSHPTRCCHRQTTGANF